MTTTTKRVGLLNVLASLLLASGCVTTEPSNLSAPTSSQTFTGFASQPGATVELYAFSKQANAWELTPDTTTTASSSPSTYGGSTGYYWAIESTLVETATDWCRVKPGCSPNSEGDLRVQFREIGGSVNPLLTFDDGGLTCTINAVENGENLLQSAWNCKAQTFDELRIVFIE